MFLLSKNIVVLSVSDTQIGIAEFAIKRGSTELLNSYVLPIPANVIFHGAIKNKAETIVLAKKALFEARPGGILSKEVLIVLPEQQMYMTVLHFTASKLPQEVLQDVPREALATIPLDPRNIYCDFFESLAEEKRHEIMYVAADKTVVDSYLDVMVKLGLKPIGVVTEPESLIAGHGAMLPQKDPLLILSIGKKRSYWIITEGAAIKKIAPSKLVANIGDISSPEAIETLQAEAQVLLGSYQLSEEQIAIPRQIFVWSEVDANHTLPHLTEQLSALLKMNASLLFPVFPNQPRSTQTLWGAISLFLSNAKRKKFSDLLPKHFREQATLLLVNTFVTIYSIMVMLAASGAISVFSYAWSEMYFEHQRAHREVQTADHTIVDPRTTRYAEIKEKTTGFNSEVDTLVQIQSRLFTYHELWNDIEKGVFGYGISPTSVEFSNKDLTFRIVGIADTRDDLTLFKRKLESIPVVSEVVSPLSNFDKNADISFLFTIKLDPQKLPYLTRT